MGLFRPVDVTSLKTKENSKIGSDKGTEGMDLLLLLLTS